MVRKTHPTTDFSRQFFMGFAPPANNEKFMPAFAFDLEL
jgi:hypothetical protein